MKIKGDAQFSTLTLKIFQVEFWQFLPGGTPGQRIDHLRNVRNAACLHSFSPEKSANHIQVQTFKDTHVLKAGLSREDYDAVVKS